MKKFVFAGFVAAASLGLAACADSADDDAMVKEQAVAEEEAPAIVSPAEEMDAGAEAMTDEPDATGEQDGVDASLEPNGDEDGPRPVRD